MYRSLNCFAVYRTHHAAKRMANPSSFLPLWRQASAATMLHPPAAAAAAATTTRPPDRAAITWPWVQIDAAHCTVIRCMQVTPASTLCRLRRLPMRSLHRRVCTACPADRQAAGRAMSRRRARPRKAHRICRWAAGTCVTASVWCLAVPLPTIAASRVRCCIRIMRGSLRCAWSMPRHWSERRHRRIRHQLRMPPNFTTMDSRPTCVCARPRRRRRRRWHPWQRSAWAGVWQPRVMLTAFGAAEAVAALPPPAAAPAPPPPMLSARRAHSSASPIPGCNRSPIGTRDTASSTMDDAARLQWPPAIRCSMPSIWSTCCSGRRRAALWVPTR